MIRKVDKANRQVNGSVDVSSRDFGAVLYNYVIKHSLYYVVVLDESDDMKRIWPLNRKRHFICAKSIYRLHKAIESMGDVFQNLFNISIFDSLIEECTSFHEKPVYYHFLQYTDIL